MQQNGRQCSTGRGRRSTASLLQLFAVKSPSWWLCRVKRGLRIIEPPFRTKSEEKEEKMESSSELRVGRR